MLLEAVYIYMVAEATGTLERIKGDGMLWKVIEAYGSL